MNEIDNNQNTQVVVPETSVKVAETLTNAQEATASPFCSANTVKVYTPEELLEKRRKERKLAERRARAERDRYYAFYDDIKTDEDPSW